MDDDVTQESLDEGLASLDLTIKRHLEEYQSLKDQLAAVTTENARLAREHTQVHEWNNKLALALSDVSAMLYGSPLYDTWRKRHAEVFPLDRQLIPPSLPEEQ